MQLGSREITARRAGRGTGHTRLVPVRARLDVKLDGLTRTRQVGWSLPTSTPSSTDLRHQLGPRRPTRATEHTNGIVGDRPRGGDVARTSTAACEALQAAGLDLRRIREQPTPAGAPRQAFFRLGEVILEVVQEPEEVLAARPDGTDGPARFWGLALLSEDLELTVEQLGEHVSEIRAAVQPGRRIATLRRSAGLAVPIALMSATEN